jgi:microcystin-dependent protein
MSDHYVGILTTQGLAKIAAAIADSTTVALTTMAVGDGYGYYVQPDPAQTTLRHQVSAQSLSSLTYVGTQATCEALFPIEDGGYTIREFGVFDSDGVLIVTGATPELPKPTIESGAAVEHLQRVVFNVGSATAVTLEINPSILLASRQWVIDNYGLASQLPGGTTRQVLAKRSNADGDIEWVDPSAAEVVADVIEERQSLSASQTIVTLATCTTDGAAVYIGATAATLQRLASNQWTATDVDTITLSTPATGGETILVVQNEPTDPLTYLRKANALYEIAAAGETRQAWARANIGLGIGGAGWNEITAAVMQTMMPIGFVVTLGVPTNPATLYGFGAWTPIVGRVIVGLSSGDADFGTLNATPGSKTVTLTESQIPEHAHDIDGSTITSSASGSHTHTYRDRYHAEALSELGSATYRETLPTNYNGKLGADGTDSDNTTALYINSTTGTSSAHTHTTTIPDSTTGLTGGGEAHSNIQPSIVKYVWERTA